MPYDFTTGNNLVNVTETDTNTGATFKPSSFVTASIVWKALISPTSYTDAQYPYVAIGCVNEVSPTALIEYKLGEPRRNIAGDADLTLTYAQAQAALADVYSAIDAYYTSILS
jgi:hypothetical protein